MQFILPEPDPNIKIYNRTEYSIWLGMRKRCSDPKNRVYPYYGGRGIKVCKEWQSDYKQFLKDMGCRPGLEFSIDRIDNDGNYEPGNCRWATPAQQIANRRPYKPRKPKGIN
jgi:hypothetical protein